MDHHDLDELADLRRRAYGPHADIVADPAALARLRELERPTPASDGAPPPPPEPARAAGPASTPEPAPTHGPVRPARPARPVSRWWIAGWAAVVALTVGAIVFALASVRPISADGSLRQVMTLSPLGDEPGWVVSLTSGTTTHETFEVAGLTIVRSSPGMFSDGDDCVAVLPSDQPEGEQGGLSGFIHVGCGAGDLPPMVQFEVASDAPRELREMLPVGTGIRFVADGDALGVFTSE